MKFIVFFLLILPMKVLGHGNEKHVDLPKKELPAAQIINETYLKSVKPIFEKKCLDCHGGPTKFPWYYKIPGAKQLIDHDIEESKEHMDLTSPFPFKGHHTPKEDLESIAKVIEQGEMPPWRYLIMHKETKISAEETVLILKWTQDSIKLLD